MRSREVAPARLGLAARVGERVTVAVPEAALTRVAALLFGLPLAALLGGAWIGAALSAGSDVVSALVGVVSLGLTLWLVTCSSGALARTLTVAARLQRTDS